MKRLLSVLLVIAIVIAAVLIFRSRHNRDYAVQAENAWQDIKDDSTITVFDTFLRDFPKSPFAALAQQKRDSLTMEKEWRFTQGLNTLEGYLDFQQKFPTSRHNDEAQEMIDALQMEKDWQQAQEENSIAAYRSFIAAYPGTPYAQQAESRIIDLEVGNIFSGEHSTLPEAQLVASDGSGINTIEIENRTDYTLTVRYSGSQSKRLVLRPRSEGSVKLVNGRYRITASVSSSAVVPFAGTQTLEGGTYSSVYYISGY